MLIKGCPIPVNSGRDYSILKDPRRTSWDEQIECPFSEHFLLEVFTFPIYLFIHVHPHMSKYTYTFASYTTHVRRQKIFSGDLCSILRDWRCLRQLWIWGHFGFQIFYFRHNSLLIPWKLYIMHPNPAHIPVHLYPSLTPAVCPHKKN